MTNRSGTFVLVGLAALACACSTNPATGPSPMQVAPLASADGTSARGLAVATVASRGFDAEDDALDVDAAALTCVPKFKRGKTLNGDFFPLTIRVAPGCQWFAKNNERGSIAWWLTENSPAYKTRRYERGVGGVGTQTVGIFYRGGWDEPHFLDVCQGTSCGPDDPKVKRYKFTYTRP